MHKGKHEHPEVTDFKNICDTIPHEKSTRDVCSKINREKKKLHKKKRKI